MKKYFLPEISAGVFAVGARDRHLKTFDALIPLPRGTTYNSYLVRGETGTALIDTVGPGFETELAEKVSQLTDLSRLDYVVMNHAEPDHGTGITEIMKGSGAKLVTSEKGAAMASRYYGAPPDRIQTVADGATIDLGGRMLRFLSTPWLHWPETMMTYIPENKLLFSCDFFGAHAPDGVYDDEIPDIISLAKNYFAEIMMPLRPFCKRGLDMIARLEVEMIAPSHGPVYRNPEAVIAAYRKWVAGETEARALVLYVTTWGATELMARGMMETLEDQGIPAKPYNLGQYDMGELAADLVDSRAVVLGSPTILTGLHPLMTNAMNVIKLLKPPIKFGAALNTYGWSKGASKHALEFFESAKIEAVGAVEVFGPPQDDDYAKISELGCLLATRMKNSG